MSDLYYARDGKGAEKSSTYSYSRYIYFYLIVFGIAKCLYLFTCFGFTG